MSDLAPVHPLDKAFPLYPADRRQEEIIAELQVVNDKLDKLIECFTRLCESYIAANPPKVKKK